jgi:hypothetical protein
MWVMLAGYGLSYGDFTFSADAETTLHTTVAAAESTPLCFNVSVTNSHAAAMASDVVMLAFIGACDRPVSINSSRAPPNAVLTVELDK